MTKANKLWYFLLGVLAAHRRGEVCEVANACRPERQRRVSMESAEELS